MALAKTPGEGGVKHWGGRGFGVSSPALISESCEVRRLALAMPERVGVAAAGRRVSCSRHDKPRSPARHNTALCLIAGPENLEGEVSRHVLRQRHRERQLNITSGCAVPGPSKAKPQARSVSHTCDHEHRRFCRSPMPAAERSKVIYSRDCWPIFRRSRASASQLL